MSAQCNAAKQAGITNMTRPKIFTPYERCLPPHNINLDKRTESVNYGKYVTNTLENDVSWAKTERFPMRSSPMTKFVDDMSLTNREFSLF